MAKKDRQKASARWSDRDLLLRSATVAGITVKGMTNAQAIAQFQQKYHLPETGRLDEATRYKMTSVAASRGFRSASLKAGPASELKVLKRPLSLNMKGEPVNTLQKGLAFLGYRIDQAEYTAKVFGGTTRKAVLAYQKGRELPQTGKYDKPTVQALTEDILKVNPDAGPARLCTIRGSVRNLYWNPMEGVQVEVRYADQEGFYAERKTDRNGFYHLPFPAPQGWSKDGVRPFDLYVTLCEGNVILEERVVRVVSQTTWVNFTETDKDGKRSFDGVYKGPSEYEKVEQGAHGMLTVFSQNPDAPINLSRLNFPPQAGFSVQQYKWLVLARFLCTNIQRYVGSLREVSIPVDVFYGLLTQGVLDEKLSDPFFAYGVFRKHPSRVDHFLPLFMKAIFTQRAQLLQSAFQMASIGNVIRRSSQVKGGEIWNQILAARYSTLVLADILDDQGILSGLLASAGIQTGKWQEIGRIYGEHMCFDDLFRKDLDSCRLLTEREKSAFMKAVEAGRIVLNRADLIRGLLAAVGSAPVRTVAKWDTKDWKEIGAADDVQVKIRARVAERYPEEVYIVGLKRLMPDDPTVDRLYQGLIFEEGEKRLVLSDIDSVTGYEYSEKEVTDLERRRAVKSLRRLYLISPVPLITKVLWEKGLTSAMAIRYTCDRSVFLRELTDAGVDKADAEKAWSNVEAQYMRVISFYNAYAAKTEGKPGRQANLQNLFGSQDAYEYDKSMSLLGQSAYFVDLLRFLRKMPADNGGTAYDLLVERRPDLVRLNLDGRNSETVLPYIDLVCEILEREIRKWTISREIDYTKYNTTDTSERLLALPANVDQEVYVQLCEAAFPATTSGFNLWQEEVRAYLEALGLPRYRLMEMFGADDAAVAAEFFGFSRQEAAAFSGPVKYTAAQLRAQWAVADGPVPVRTFRRKTGLTYDETVRLCRLFGFSLTGADLTGKGYPDIDSQYIVFDAGLPEGLCLLQRFIRLWRKSGWEMDRLYEFVTVECDGQLDESTLTALYKEIRFGSAVAEEIGSIVGSLLEHSGVAAEADVPAGAQAAEASGIPEETLKSWARIGTPDQEKALAGETLGWLKRKYGAKWPEEIRKVYDPVREKKRDALVAYILESVSRKAQNTVLPDWKDTDDILAALLVDVMMNAPMETSRTKQAIGSVQLFVQRCLLNLEDGLHVDAAERNDTTSADSWYQWAWMKNYRVWEANRKIFLFPENWTEPELRDSQTPFFTEFLDQVDQVDATTENLEDALLGYLYKLDEVARLEACSLYRQIDPDTHKDILHLVARTQSVPTVYYYRSCDLHAGLWSAWERIDVDITGDQLTLAAYRGKVYLFWLTFIEKALKPENLQSVGSNSPTANEPLSYYEIQLAWTTRKQETWVSKSTSRLKLIHPWPRPQYSYDLKPFQDRQGRLLLDIYLSTSEEFNRPGVTMSDVLYPDFGPRYRTAPFCEAFRPWHSSTFVFEGHVTEVYMKDISYGQYHSLAYINKHFGEDGRKIKPMPVEITGQALRLPTGMHLKANRLVNRTGFTPRLNVGENTAQYTTRTLLEKPGNPYELLISQQTLQMDALWKGALMFFQDNRRVYSIRTSGYFQYRFEPFYHPFASQFIKTLNQKGLDGLMTTEMQTLDGSFSFGNSYRPTPSVDTRYPVEKVDFSLEGPYSIYNWELFFHIPLTIACRLSQNNRFEDAMKWFHYIFNPMEYAEGRVPQCYWVTAPFQENSLPGGNGTSAGRIETILKNISANAAQMTAWKNNPFKPHIIAQYRTETYQKTVVMKYIDNLIAWADSLFRQDTWETINEAVMLYLMAAEILGRRPEKVAADSLPQRAVTDFMGLADNLDAFGNEREKANPVLQTMLTMEDMADVSGFRGEVDGTGSPELPTLDVYYFSVPSNDDLLSYWDTVEDRMYKIRNSMNIDGVVRSLGLNAPEIDPGALVRAAAAGLSIGEAVLDVQPDRPPYRFRTMLQKAFELCAEVQSIGEKLLSAIEKEDAAQLAVLRQEQELRTLENVSALRRMEIESAKENIRQLEAARGRAETVLDFYENIEQISAKEAKVLSIATQTLDDLTKIKGLEGAAAGVSLIPSIVTGVHGLASTPVADSEIFSGKALASCLNFAAGILSAGNQQNAQKSGILASKAGYERRSDDWRLQAATAAKDLESIESQIRSAEIRLSMAEQELENHRAQIENSNAVYQQVKQQFSNQALYTWLRNQTVKLYRQIYDIAYSYAKKAELCYDYELGDNTEQKTFIQTGNFIQEKQGLLAGDHLRLQLRQLEQSYLENDRRCYELTKRISLAELTAVNSDDSALVALLRDGACTFDLPEWLYDLDYPTHGNRRIKSVSVTIPCVVGPNTNVNCKLTLLKEQRRTKGVKGRLGLDMDTANDVHDASIATSTAVNDAGLFEVDFRGEKYLPFEGYGAISRWRIELPAETNHFDRSTVSDVILTVTYYAQERGAHETEPMTFIRLVSARHEFPAEWHRCAQEGGDLRLTLTEDSIQSYLRDRLKSGFALTAAVRQERPGGALRYESLSGGYAKDGMTLSVTGAGSLIASGTEDILLVLSCNYRK